MTTHGKPPTGLECLASYEAIDESNYVEFQSSPSGTWSMCRYSQETVEQLLDSSFQLYLKDVEKAAKDCAAAVRRLVSKGPPVYLSDCNHSDALPLPAGDTHVEQFWFMNGNQLVSAKLKGALEGKEREDLWNAQKETLAAMEAVEAGSN